MIATRVSPHSGALQAMVKYIQVQQYKIHIDMINTLLEQQITYHC